MLGDSPRERDHVVVRLGKEFGRAFSLHGCRADRGHVFFGDDTHLGPGFAHRQLDAEPQLHAVLVGPHAAHFRARISRNHRVATAISTPISRRNCFPSKLIAAAAAYTALGWEPTRVSTRPPKVTRLPLGSRRVPA